MLLDNRWVDDDNNRRDVKSEQQQSEHWPLGHTVPNTGIWQIAAEVHILRALTDVNPDPAQNWSD
jgi:hypothetical protein